MLTNILALAGKTAEHTDPDSTSNSAWVFIKRNFLNAEFYSSHMEIHIHYGTVALIVAIIFFWILFKIQRRRPA